MEQICDVKDCLGCFACMNICPKNAISVGYDAMGKTIPEIDEKLCVSCNACKKVCPAEQQPKLRKPLSAFAVCSREKADTKLSSSGGAAAVFSRKTIEKNGVVFGAAYKDNTVKHIMAEALQDIEMLRGSKYVQSSIGNTYQEVRRLLKEQRKVLFIGTPCQVAGLICFMGEENDNLITVDLICHGTPPIKYLDEHLKHQLTQQWTDVTFRGKYDFFLTAYNGSKIIYQKKRYCDLYFSSFLKGLTYRDNCYHCRYACPERASDITIGDFWGIDHSTLKNKYDGRISLVLTNTEKGEEFFKQNSDGFVWERRALEEAFNPEQGNLLRPSKMHKDRSRFEKEYRMHGFDKAVKGTEIGKDVKKEVLRDSIRKSMLYGVLRKIKHILIR